MIREINLKGRKIKYDLQIKNVKNINLRIKADRSIFVSANSNVSEEDIRDFLISKSEYIINALEYYEELARYSPKPKQYVDGETFYIFGHDRRLKVAQGNKNSVSSDEAYIYLTVKEPDNLELKKKTIDKWLVKICREKVLEICKEVYPKFQKYDIVFPQIRFRTMISRWGSCQPKRKILTFNYALVEVPVSCIEYVVNHEFTHFIHPNHSRKFYQCLSMFMPDWKQRKITLENSGHFSE